MFCGGGIHGVAGGGGILGLFFNILPILFWAAIIFTAYYLFKKYSDKNVPSKSPIDILKERYAKGEISEADFERMKSQL